MDGRFLNTSGRARVLSRTSYVVYQFDEILLALGAYISTEIEVKVTHYCRFN
jgi:hypothetical protein